MKALLPAALALLATAPVLAQDAGGLTTGSGTAWQPPGLPMAGVHGRVGDWRLMLHYDAVVQYARDGGLRGESEVASTNWVMGHARRPWSGGALEARAMMSLEPFTIPGCGVPNLLQTGELCDGVPIVDAQHPHDLFMEIAGRWTRPVGPVAVEVYLAPVGEPALGPVAFPHRASAAFDPLAPITHHWLDATHISFGVATVGASGARWKVDASLFNGKEPDDERTDFDFGPLESYAGRVQLAPAPGWVAQASYGRLENAHRHLTLLPPELLCPAHGGACHPVESPDDDLDVDRFTASVTHHRPLGERRLWATTAAWGRNQEQDHAATSALLIESRLDLPEGHHVVGRAEVVTKSDHDLGLRPTLQQYLAGEERTFRVAKVALGWARTFEVPGPVAPALGAVATWSRVPDALAPHYGEGDPVGLVVYTVFRPSAP